MRWKTLIVAVIAVAAAGCADNKATQREQAVQQWNAARAAVQYGLAKQQYEGGNLPQAVKAIDEAQRLDPSNAGIRILAARIAIEQGQLETAERHLQEARRLAPANAEAEYYSGVIYQRWQKPQAALECYERAMTKAPAELPYVLARAEMLVAVGRAGDALAVLQEKIVYFENSTAIRDSAGQILMSLGRYAEATDMLRQASILGADDMVIREHYALALYYGGKFREARESLARVLALPRWQKRADLILAAAECDLATGSLREARAGFESAAEIDPTLAGAWLGLAKAAMELNDARRCETSIRKAMALEPGSAEPHLLMGYLRLRGKQYADALVAFRKASALDAKDPASVCMIGYVYEQLKQNDKAIEFYAKALKLKPNDDMATRLLAGIDTGE